MINKIFQEFTNEKYNQQNNFDTIMFKVKKSKTKKKFKISNMVAVILVLFTISCVTPIIYAKINWNAEFKNYLYRPTEQAQGSLEKTKNSDYAEVINMDYLTQDEIGVKVDSMLITDTCFDANITFKFSPNKVVDSQGFSFAYAVYDDNSNIYGILNRVHSNPNRITNISPFLHKELGLKYSNFTPDKYIFSDHSSTSLKEVNENERTITQTITLNAKKTFPKSKKIFIRVFDLGYRMLETDQAENVVAVETFDTSNAEWIFEIDVPDKFLDRKTLQLIPQNDIPELEIKNITITETNLVINCKTEADYNIYNILTISDGDGKIYENMLSSINSKNCKLTFDVGTKELSKKLFINFTINNKTYTSELIEK